MSECKDYVIVREITTVLKITVDYAILELCDSCDFFASPLINICLLVLMLDSKGIINTIKMYDLQLRNALTLQLCGRQDFVYFATLFC